MTDRAPQTERLYTLAEGAKIAKASVAGILKACRAGALPGAVLVERDGREIYMLTWEAVGWLELLAEKQEKQFRRAHDCTYGMLRIGGNYHAMKGAVGSNGRRGRHGS